MPNKIVAFLILAIYCLNTVSVQAGRGHFGSYHSNICHSQLKNFRDDQKRNRTTQAKQAKFFRKQFVDSQIVTITPKTAQSREDTHSFLDSIATHPEFMQPSEAVPTGDSFKGTLRLRPSASAVSLLLLTLCLTTSVGAAATQNPCDQEFNAIFSQPIESNVSKMSWLSSTPYKTIVDLQSGDITGDFGRIGVPPQWEFIDFVFKNPNALIVASTPINESECVCSFHQLNVSCEVSKTDTLTEASTLIETLKHHSLENKEVNKLFDFINAPPLISCGPIESGIAYASLALQPILGTEGDTIKAPLGNIRFNYEELYLSPGPHMIGMLDKDGEGAKTTTFFLKTGDYCIVLEKHPGDQLATLREVSSRFQRNLWEKANPSPTPVQPVSENRIGEGAVGLRSASSKKAHKKKASNTSTAPVHPVSEKRTEEGAVESQSASSGTGLNTTADDTSTLQDQVLSSNKHPSFVAGNLLILTGFVAGAFYYLKKKFSKQQQTPPVAEEESELIEVFSQV
jgi:hypothetical protein